MLRFLAFKIFSSCYSNWRNHFLIFIKVEIQPQLFFSHCIAFSCCSIWLLSCCYLHLKFVFPLILVVCFVCFYSHYSLLLADWIHFYLSHFSFDLSFFLFKSFLHLISELFLLTVFESWLSFGTYLNCFRQDSQSPHFSIFFAIFK